MKILLITIALLVAWTSWAQVPPYYNSVNLNASGQSLKNSLASKISSTHANNVSYTPGAWNALRQSDLDIGSSSRVRLIYGYNDNDGNSITDRTRNKYQHGGASTDWNREHVYPKSLGTPNLGTSGPGADLHHLCPADARRNSTRNNRKFADGAGNSKITAQGYWYPGDEFKGDVARMMMYMYLRYGNRCLPKNVGTGSTVSSDRDMLQLFLEWNVEDPVSSFEEQRNNVIASIQGNRNPFIDNPIFATQIWGGTAAEDRFGSGGNTGGGNTGGTTINVRLTLTFDNYPGETSWEIVNDANQVVHAGGTYGSQAGGSTLQINKTLSAGCYQLIMRDSYGDGMCCTYGNGSFVFTNMTTGNTITSGGSFGATKTKSFCVGTSARNNVVEELEESKIVESIEWTLYPNPAKDWLRVQGTGLDQQVYQIVTVTGQVVQTGTVEKNQISLEELERGIYFLVIMNDQERWVKRFIKA